ncbi:MAG: VTT domain-containing protein [Nitrospira sp.]
MVISPQEALSVLEHYRYWIIFPIAVFEGPIIIIISGFLVSLGILNGFIAYAILLVADMIGDSMYYCIGRYGSKTKWFKKLGKFVGYNENGEKYLENHFRTHKVKTFLIAKISHGLGGSVQVASGIAGVSYKEFFWLSLLGTAPKTLFLLFVGIYMGSYYERIDGYLHYIAVFVISIVVVIALAVISKKIAKKALAKDDVDVV